MLLYADSFLYFLSIPHGEYHTLYQILCESYSFFVHLMSKNMNHNHRFLRSRFQNLSFVLRRKAMLSLTSFCHSISFYIHRSHAVVLHHFHEINLLLSEEYLIKTSRFLQRSVHILKSMFPMI